MTALASRLKPTTGVRQARYVVLAAALAAFLAKAWLAWRTLGQDDTYIWWPTFMRAVHDHGPVGVYGQEMVGQPYNHPPLTGWWLVALDYLRLHTNVPLGFWIRIGSVVADFFCGWVIFEVLRRRQPLWQATAAGALVAASPVLYVISGYHGNHDPEIMFLAILSGFLLVDKRLAGPGRHRAGHRGQPQAPGRAGGAGRLRRRVRARPPDAAPVHGRLRRADGRALAATAARPRASRSSRTCCSTPATASPGSGDRSRSPGRCARHSA